MSDPVPDPEPPYSAPPYSAPAYSEPTYNEPPYSEPPAFAVSNPPQYAEQYAEQDRYDETLYGRIDPALDPSGFPPPGAYSNDPYDYQDPYGDGAQEQKPRRGGGMITVVAVLALAVVGTGAAFGYRTLMGSTRSGEPPVIRADAGPTKVVPAPSAEASSKQIQDRLGGGNGTEMLVSREEQPIDPATSSPRVVLQQLNQNPNPPSPSAVAPNAQPLVARPNNGTLAGDEPRKIRTFAVRPDRADPAATPTAAPTARPTSAHNAASHTPPAQSATANANASANAPLSLSPAAESPRTRMASAPTSLQSAGASGGYLVQVSSQRSEADARTSFRVLQGKFPSVLGSQSAVIKRADLGQRGVYYRAMVGPFGSSDEASRLCGNLKSAGGQCVVQRN
ncbi:SPOR domain-containing protein [Rhodopseudomonas sp. BAL398]|uniref:SPOR domain-containing protein n=1 Tax=Rhodopseudomonas TaxID=1073 RepID=UPI00294A9EC1|nr:SPOR domain-containing protein [Rhodopseudomonas sp. BAL398]WOK19078.1 SPOR domain-containing protein [Rhodopseudomonas sp. BAL398]